MPIIFDDKNRIFKLDTCNTSYIFGVNNENMLVHLYYGGKLPHTELSYFSGLLNNFESSTVEHPNYNDLRLVSFEYAPFGMDNYNESAFAIKDENGNATCDIRYESYSVSQGKKSLCGLPATYSENEEDVVSLEVCCRDNKTGLEIVLQYSVFEKKDAITRSAKFKNTGENELIIEKALSLNVDLPVENYEMISLPGGWARERHTERYPVRHGQNYLSSNEGKTSHAMNNFFAVCLPDSTETYGEVYGCCLVYSGNFLAGVSLKDSEQARMITGINPSGFEWMLKCGEAFQTPEAILIYSQKGIGHMSRLYHDLMRENLIRGKWKNIERPVLINNWEATYFDFNSEKLLEIATQAKEIGLDMLVMDDGWFGERNNDDSSLGDWVVNLNKIPEGINSLVKKINSLGMKFGIWFEPEMVSPNSELYRKHPDWCLHINGRERFLSRKQLVLDFSRKEVRDYVYEQMKSILSSANIEYVKWDHNRSLSEVGNEVEEYSMQMSLAHKNILGVYEVQEHLIKDFPDLLLENCSGGGGRFDAGMLYYSPQIWLSDNTDAYERMLIQHGSSLCYPCSTFGSHVSTVPNHQVGRITPLSARSAVAMVGTFGCELDITKMSLEEKAELKEQILLYKKHNKLINNGDLYRLTDPNIRYDYNAWQFVSKDKKEVLLEYVRILNIPNKNTDIIRLQGLDPQKTYCNENGKKYSGAMLMNVGIPITLQMGDFSSEVIYFKEVEYIMTI